MGTVPLTSWTAELLTLGLLADDYGRSVSCRSCGASPGDPCHTLTDGSTMAAVHHRRRNVTPPAALRNESV